ncbi:malonate decarboxylase acyl carrier protein [Marinococcus halophilus]|uniref:Malonate decarboxylase acyl carrier protein n=1 Tax=Marinococcus halophilus TaxID=1371 RepID=A0A510YB05_MARHA|nr:malonate decarboxylase subunit delta [Marinococcus halophilus]OZT79178.1 malonate decarboxylase acyl carrier protein [Marinococcus halophilus]GEK59841.1 malonate decarboxylase acyl carrier protein [Marinococcus halophilus]
MNTLTLEYPASKSIQKKAHTGIVGSGDLEVLMRPAAGEQSTVEIRTSLDGFEDMWRYVLDRFMEENEPAVHIQVNDFGATPGVVKLRLEQALEEGNDEVNQ